MVVLLLLCWHSSLIIVPHLDSMMKCQAWWCRAASHSAHDVHMQRTKAGMQDWRLLELYLQPCNQIPISWTLGFSWFLFDFATLNKAWGRRTRRDLSYIAKVHLQANTKQDECDISPEAYLHKGLEPPPYYVKCLRYPLSFGEYQRKCLHGGSPCVSPKDTHLYSKAGVYNLHALRYFL